MKKVLFICVTMLLICISGKATERNLLLIPYPQQVSIKQGNYNLTDNVKIGADPLFTQELKKLQEVLTEDFGLKSQIVKPSKADISLCYDASFMQEEKEAYQLEVTDMKITIRAQMATGIFYGIQSLRQLIKSEAGKWIIPKLTITDYPALSWRSFMLDEGRYFKGEKVVKQILDEMALLKMNVFQWHLTDDQGWRIEIKKYPRLTEIGAFRDSTQMEWYESHHYDGKPHGGFYTQTQIRSIIKYASERHITIIPEIEMPGHSAAAIAAYPWLSATGKEIKVPCNFGVQYDVFNVTDPKVLNFLNDTRNYQFRPVLLSLFEAMEHGLISASKVERYLMSIKNFLAIFVVVCKEKTNAIEKLVYDYSLSLHKDFSKELMDDFIDKLFDKINKELFVSDFCQIEFTNNKKHSSIKRNCRKD